MNGSYPHNPSNRRWRSRREPGSRLCVPKTRTQLTAARSAECVAVRTRGSANTAPTAASPEALPPVNRQQLIVSTPTHLHCYATSNRFLPEAFWFCTWFWITAIRLPFPRDKDRPWSTVYHTTRRIKRTVLVFYNQGDHIGQHVW